MPNPLQTNSGASNATSLAVAFLSNNIAGNFLFAGLNSAAGLGSEGITDSRNSYSNDVAQVSNGDSKAGVWTALNCGAGANTVTATGGGSGNREMIIAEYPTVALVSAFDKSVSATGFGTALASGNTATTTQSDELIIGFAGAGNSANQPYTPGATFTERAESGGGNNLPCCLEDK